MEMVEDMGPISANTGAVQDNVDTPRYSKIRRILGRLFALFPGFAAGPFVSSVSVPQDGPLPLQANDNRALNSLADDYIDEMAAPFNMEEVKRELAEARKCFL